MQVMVLCVNDDMVHVKSDIGDFQGVWKSANPAERRTYHVELDCDDVIGSDSVQFSLEDTSYIVKNHDRIKISGLAEEVEDEVLFLRIADSLLMLEVEDNCNFTR